MFFSAFTALAEGSAPVFSFGVVADCQYCNADTAGVRHYKLSEEKLASCVEVLNTFALAFTVHLGDFIDRDFESFNVVSPIFKRLNCPQYHVLGNHDYAVADEHKAHIYRELGMPARYYDRFVKGWRFIMLDGNDVSLHAYPKGSPEYKAAEKYHKENVPEAMTWNGAVGEEQLAWLEQRLKWAETAKEKVILFAHFPVYPENVHNLWNAPAIVSLVKNYPCVKAYMNGHNHAGNFGTDSEIPYLTFKGMVDTEESAFAVVDVYEDRLVVKGHGREENRTLPIR